MTILTNGPASYEVSNGGAGPFFDPIAYRGKFFASGVPQGSITQVCIFGQTAGTTATVGIAAEVIGVPLASVPIAVSSSNAWNCAATALPWTTSSLFMYKISGNAAIGADEQQPHDSRFRAGDGVTWGSDPARRGYKVVIVLS